MRLTDLPLDDLTFRTSEAVREPIRRACAANPDIARFHDLGASGEGRPLYGVTLGYGPEVITLIAGAHADEPVGPETLRTLIMETLAHRDWDAEGGGFAGLFERFTLRIIPHLNPDGEARNWDWIDGWEQHDSPERAVQHFLRHRCRELPGRDIEFGFPVMRAENRAASAFLFDYAPLALHLSLHGMAFSEGALLLLERRWADSHPEPLTSLQAGWSEAAAAAHLDLHDHDRGGDKGFRYYGPGFWSTPEGIAMQAHFLAHGDEDTARKFFLSSMEWAYLTGYDAERTRHPLSLVTELPLFVVGGDGHSREPGVPARLHAFKHALTELQDRILGGGDVSAELTPFRLLRLDLVTGVRLQLRAIELGLEAISGAGSSIDI